VSWLVRPLSDAVVVRGQEKTRLNGLTTAFQD